MQPNTLINLSEPTQKPFLLVLQPVCLTASCNKIRGKL